MIYSFQLFFKYVRSGADPQYTKEMNKILRKKRYWVYAWVTVIVVVFHVQFFVFIGTACKDTQNDKAIDNR